MGKGYRTDYGVIGEYLRCMLFHFIAWEEFIFLIVFITIFGLSFYKIKLGISWNSYLLVWLVVMNFNFFNYLLLLFAMWPFDWFITKKTLFHPQPKIRSYTFLHYFTWMCKTHKVFNLHLHLNGLYISVFFFNLLMSNFLWLCHQS